MTQDKEKKLSISPRPQRKNFDPEQFVSGAGPQSKGEAEPVKRLTIDIPQSLHTRAKSQAAAQHVTLRDEVIKFLEKRFPDGVQ